VYTVLKLNYKARKMWLMYMYFLANPSKKDYGEV